MSQIFNPQQNILCHLDKVESYFNNKNPDPITIEIDPSNSCNHSCPFCISGHLHLQKYKGTEFFNRTILEKECFKKLVKELVTTNIQAINWTGGGEPTMNPYLGEAIGAAADAGVKFLFMNTKPFNYQHPNIKYSEANTDLNTKTAFINTCDAMIHGRIDGESFGLSIAEFLHQNKPVVTNIHCRDRNHIHVLGDKGLYYSNANELYAILTSFEKKDYNVKPLVDQFKPEIVMEKFKSLIDG